MDLLNSTRHVGQSAKFYYILKLRPKIFFLKNEAKIFFKSKILYQNIITQQNLLLKKKNISQQYFYAIFYVYRDDILTIFKMLIFIKSTPILMDLLGEDDLMRNNLLRDYTTDLRKKCPLFNSKHNEKIHFTKWALLNYRVKRSN